MPFCNSGPSLYSQQNTLYYNASADASIFFTFHSPLYSRLRSAKENRCRPSADGMPVSRATRRKPFFSSCSSSFSSSSENPSGHKNTSGVSFPAKTSVNKQISQKQYKMFQQISDQADDIPDYEICLAYGFREKHDYRNKNEINTMKIGEHIGILLLFKLPKEVKEMIEDNEVYSIVWDFMMRLEEQLPRAFMYYGVMDENKFEQQSSEIGIFLPFRHFEHQLEKNIEQANGIGLGCRERILTMIK